MKFLIRTILRSYSQGEFSTFAKEMFLSSFVFNTLYSELNFAEIKFVYREHLSQVPGRAHRQDEGLEAGRGPPAGQGAGERREGSEA